MRLGRRRHDEENAGLRLAEERHAGAVAPPADRASGTYRVAVAFSEGDHAPAHWGPAYNAAFAELVAHVRDIAPADVDLYQEALLGAGRCAAEHGAGWTVWVERLRVNPAGDGGEWEKVG